MPLTNVPHQRPIRGYKTRTPNLAMAAVIAVFVIIALLLAFTQL